MHAVKAFRYEKFQSTLSVRRATNAKTGFSALSLFQSTLSVRRATQTMVNKNNLLTISIHALREESDIQTTINDTNSSTFQSTLSVRRATLHLVQHLQSASISIHALREESDQGEERFHPESEISIHALREESDPQVHFMHLPIGISIHALREESDRMPDQTATAWRNFNPRSP